MAQNTTDAYRKFRYYEGVCSSSDFIKEIAKVVSLGVKTEARKDIDGNIIEPATVLRKNNWDIVYPMVDSNFPVQENAPLNSRDNYLAHIGEYTDSEIWEEKLNNQIAQIKDMVVLRTTTTPKDIASDAVDDLSVSGDSNEASHTMYVQLYKPKYLANPEEYPLDAELQGLTPQLITKDMYREARKSTASVIYDLSQLADNSNVKCPDNIGTVIKGSTDEIIDADSPAYTREYLFGDEGVLQGLTSIFGAATLDSIIVTPTASDRSQSCRIPRAYLNSINL